MRVLQAAPRDPLGITGEAWQVQIRDSIRMVLAEYYCQRIPYCNSPGQPIKPKRSSCDHFALVQVRGCDFCKDSRLSPKKRIPANAFQGILVFMKLLESLHGSLSKFGDAPEPF